MKKKKIILCIALAGCLLTSFLTGMVFLNHEGKEQSLTSEVMIEKGIRISSIKYSSTNYGSQNVHFVIDPKVHTDEILYSLKYKDGTNIEDDVFDIVFKPDDGLIRITCLRPFTKQIILTLYAKSNSNVNASITIDFKERITVTPELNVVENTPLAISNNIESSGGSISVDKSVTSSSVKFSSQFITSAQEMLYARFEQLELCNPDTTYYFSIETSYTGLDQTNCDYFFSNAYTPILFLESIKMDVSYSYQENDDDTSYDVSSTYYLTDLLTEDFFAMFDGTNPIFDYTVVVNSTTYNAQFGLLISSININNIEITTPNICF